MATDVLITQKLAIELDGKSPFEYIVMKQGDKNSRILAITLVQNKQLYEIPDGCTARIKYYKPDRNPVLNDCTISGNEILVTYTEQMLAAAGVGKGEIVLLKDNKELKSATYYTKIVESVYRNEGLVSDKEFLSMGTIFNDMDQAAQKASANAKIAETAGNNAAKAADLANSSATKANTAATVANNAAQKATEQTTAAKTATDSANSSATKANTAATAANNAAQKATEQTTAAKTATEAAQAAAENIENKANGKGITLSINELGGLRVTYDDGK